MADKSTNPAALAAEWITSTVARWRRALAATPPDFAAVADLPPLPGDVSLAAFVDLDTAAAVLDALQAGRNPIDACINVAMPGELRALATAAEPPPPVPGLLRWEVARREVRTIGRRA